MNCTGCGAVMDSGARFCGECGAPAAGTGGPAVAEAVPATLTSTAPPPQAAMKKCPFCGEEILQVAIKCRFCGSELQPAVPGALQPPSASNIVLNAPSPAAATPGAASVAPPSIVIQNVQAQQSPARPGFVPGHYKNPGLALFFSFIFPGGGQFYNGEAGKGILVLLTFWIFGIMWIWSWFDAYGSAQRINRVGF